MPFNYSFINGFKYLSGTTAQRPANPVAGSTYYNTTVGLLQVYQNGGWYVLQSVVAPATPTSVVATNVGTSRAFNNGSASVAFIPVTETGGLASSFTVTSSPGSYTATGASSPIVVTGLQSATGYTYTVTASNGASASSASSASSAVTATTVPQAPTIGTATGGDTQASVTFTTNATGGSAITGYTITSSPGNVTASGATSPVVVTGLTNGTAYSFTVTATNANGTSAASSASNSVTPVGFPTVSGGTLTSDATYYYRSFTGTSNLIVSSVALTADVLVMAGGGGGGYGYAAGAGAGGLRYFPSQSITTGTHTATVGAGGPGGGQSGYSRGSKGVTSQFSALTSVEGGGSGGAQPSQYGENGGCGGGAYGSTAGVGSIGGNGSGSGFGGGGGMGGSASGDLAGPGVSTYNSWSTTTGLGKLVSGTYWFCAGGNGETNADTSSGRTPGWNGASANTGCGGAGNGGYPAGGGSGAIIVRYTKASVGG